MTYRSIYQVDNSASYAPDYSRAYYAVEVKPVTPQSLGVYTKEAIASGSIVAKCGGIVVSSVDDAPKRRYADFIEEGLFITPRDYDNMEFIWYLNHSCNAPLARIGGLIYVAKRDIAAESELTVDYAPLIAGIPDWTMVCYCKSKQCRGVITGEDWKIPKIAQQLWSEWLPHIQKKILMSQHEQVTP